MTQRIAKGTMEYKGYTALFEWCEEDGLYNGKVLDVLETVFFEAKTVEETTGAFMKALDWYLEICAETNQEPRQSFAEAMAHSS